ncbi:MAG: ABC transporter ATP-binding protein, partial [Planctomycetes bacterium]|nr:ABC transporter ATP-binding protein [Planctomycetota bacterium]
LVSVLPLQVIGVAVDQLKPADQSVQAEGKAARPKAATKLPLAPPLQRAAGWVAGEWFPRANKAVVAFLVFGAAFFLLQLADSIVTMVHHVLMAKVGQRLIYDMRKQAYGHVQRLSFSYFEDRHTGDLMSRIVNDVNSLEQVIVGPVVSLLTDFCRLGWILYFCLRWDWKLTLIALTITPALSVCTFMFGRYIRQGFRDLRTKVGELNALTQDNLSGIRIIMGFCREAHEEQRFDEKNRANYAQNVKLAYMFAVFRPIVELMTHLGTVVVLCYGGYKVLGGDMSLGVFVVFMPYLGMLYGPITGFTRFYNFIQRAVASVERVFEVLDTVPEVKDAPDAVELGRVEGHVELRGVSFAYSNGVVVLSDISLQAKPGQMIALVGPSGAGKSTLTNLIPRFYDPKQGVIVVDGHDIRKVKLLSLRRQMAMVLQDPFLFNDTVKANILYGKLGATDEEVIAAAQAANAHEFIVKLPKGYDSTIGERGVKLSGGQKQRLAIARAVLADPRILILDEATSSVDTETEILIQNAIYRLVKNRTTFVIAHRLSTVLRADLIVVLDHGRVVETGTHPELLAKGNLYAKLYELQFRTESGSPPKPAPRTAPAHADSVEERFGDLVR